MERDVDPEEPMNDVARRIQRVYLTLMLGNTLAASFIWGINTLFLLDAGLSNLEAFAANAFFTAGMVLFEVPTGVVADTWGRRVVVPARHAHPGRLDAPLLAAVAVERAVLGRGRSCRVLLGLGFTFFSGAVEAWLVDALRVAEYDGALEAVFGRGQMVGGRRDARRLGARRRDRPGDDARRAVPDAGRRAAGDVRRRVRA